jgi:hypothetical protein
MSIAGRTPLLVEEGCPKGGVVGVTTRVNPGFFRGYSARLGRARVFVDAHLGMTNWLAIGWLCIRARF